MNRWKCAVGLCLGALVILEGTGHPEEGMWPISEIHKLDLKARGLEIEPGEIFNPEGESLILAVVNVGASGSFVSRTGLIITNHHVAYGAVQAASTEEKDYVREGFIARNRAEEIPAQGRTARVTESFRDVSSEVLSAIESDMTNADRTRAIEARMKEIVRSAEKIHPGKRAEVAEMFPGKTYVLFVYTFLRDIRLVYVPPRSIGEFGGETDNWMWPRHTGDFAFFRAYVAADGSPAAYSKDNVPYTPKKYLRINPGGVHEGDFVFMLGYPGRTYRHETSHFLAYEEEVRMPYVADWYAWQIDLMQQMSTADRTVALKHLSRIKGLSNTMKNYRGKLQGLKRLNLTQRKREEEVKLMEFIRADPIRKSRFGDLLEKTEAIYRDLRQRSESELILDSLRRHVNMISFAYTAYEASIEFPKKDIERESAYMERNFPQTRERLFLALKDYYEPTDRAVLKALFMKAAQLPREYRIQALERIVGGPEPEKSVDAFVDEAYGRTKLTNRGNLVEALNTPTRDLKGLDDPFIQLAEKLYPEYQKLERIRDEREGALDRLAADLLEVKQLFLEKEFIPDANRTLRMTYGRIRGYEPVDAVDYHPLTTFRGVIEKTTGEEPFDTPSELIELHQAGDFGRFALPDLETIPVCMLYDMDTTGGNSGSPVLNAQGELVGVNFDRAWEATINDFAWSESYSRSIGVDIRYVLWVTQKYGRVDYLIEEMLGTDLN